MSDIYDRDWDDVTVILVYRDGNKVATREVRVNREEEQQEIRNNILQDTGEESDFELTPDVFKAKVMNSAAKLASEPIYPPPTPGSNETRILPPWNVLEVKIRVNNLTQIHIA